MILKNNTKRKYVHSYLDENAKLKMIVLQPNCTLEVPQEVADSWLKIEGIIEYIEPKKVKDIEAENAKLKAELDKLKAFAVEIKDLKSVQPKKSEQKAPKEIKTKSKSKKN